LTGAYRKALANPHLQTIASTLSIAPDPPAHEQRVMLDDGDQISLQITEPIVDKGRTVLLLHGLCGSHTSVYMRRLAAVCRQKGFRAVRMNMRGWGSGLGLARQVAHSGRSADLIAVLRMLRRDYPNDRLTAIGFSMGGNITLKAVAELGSDAPALIDQATAVCAPIDLEAAVQRIHLPHNRIYESYFILRLLRFLRRQHQAFPEFPSYALSPLTSLYAFDDRVTAPLSGFASAHDYYQRCSANHLLGRIAVPTKLVITQDDPFIHPSDYVAIKNPWISTHMPATGGHMGFFDYHPAEGLQCTLYDTLTRDLT